MIEECPGYISNSTHDFCLLGMNLSEPGTCVILFIMIGLFTMAVAMRGDG